MTDRHLGPARILRHSTQDMPFIALAMAHAIVLVLWPSIAVVAIGLWWNANTIAHNFIHRPFFRSRGLNRLFSAVLSLILGVPQSLWRRRHLRHHAEAMVRSHNAATTVVVDSSLGSVGPKTLVETLFILGLWTMMAARAPLMFWTSYVPGWAIGLALCQLQGHYEHSHGTTSHYGRLYNRLFFNDGYHVEHHARPTEDWRRLGTRRRAHARGHRWPAVLRWLDVFSLDGLERLVLGSPILQRFVLRAHERAFQQLMPHLGDVRTVLVVGGGLFPRTALVLRRLLPAARLTVVDAKALHLASARHFLDADVALDCRVFDADRATTADLVVVPLAYVGNRHAFYAHPPAPVVLVHEWIWSRRGDGVVISWLLLKRLNVVVRTHRALQQAV